jgi:hypothetical protein
LHVPVVHDRWIVQGQLKVREARARLDAAAVFRAGLAGCWPKQEGLMRTMIRLAAAVLWAGVFAVAAIPAQAQQTPAAPGAKAARATEAPLRKFITDMQKGTTDYSTMVEPLANAVRGSMPASGQRLIDQGALKSLEYTETGPGGMDIYRVTFEKGALSFRISLTADGKIGGLLMGPAQ